jgi:hypothetical protein
MNTLSNKKHAQLPVFFGACLKIRPKRRVRARGLQEMARISTPCRPGPLTGRFFIHSLMTASSLGTLIASHAAENSAAEIVKDNTTFAVEVRSCAVKNRAVSNRNCVPAMRRGEQRNENDQSVTQIVRRDNHRELDSVGVSGRVC